MIREHLLTISIHGEVNTRTTTAQLLLLQLHYVCRKLRSTPATRDASPPPLSASTPAWRRAPCDSEPSRATACPAGQRPACCVAPSAPPSTAVGPVPLAPAASSPLPHTCGGACPGAPTAPSPPRGREAGGGKPPAKVPASRSAPEVNRVDDGTALPPLLSPPPAPVGAR